jgi:OOP family OmpA-OmpF porin
MRRASTWLAFTALAASLLVRAAGAADFEEKRFYITPFIGWTFFDTERRVVTGADLPNDLYYGGRAGVRLNQLFWIDVAGGYSEVSTCCDWVEWTHFSGNLMMSRASLQTINPFISLGGGWSSYTHSVGPDENAGTLEAAAGLRVRLNEALGLRLEARNILAVPKGSWAKAHIDDIVVGAGLTFAFGGKSRAGDSDGDGVPDGRDNCPDTPRGCTVDVHGCPTDSDHDGVCDGRDQCPNTLSGCQVDERGCPIDSDRDGVCDGLDQCPNTLSGCRVDAQGCPIDSDHDGVCDGLDQCPNSARGASVDRVGCEIAEVVPREVQERETELLNTGMLRISDINFDFDKSTIRPDSYHTLDIVGQVLTKWPGLRIEIDGHTDSRGSDAYNRALSHRRAESVRAYLLAHFPQFTPAQLTAKGFGESEPLVPNDSDEHRATNRRVEFKVLNKEMLKRDK